MTSQNFTTIASIRNHLSHSSQRKILRLFSLNNRYFKDPSSKLNFFLQLEQITIIVFLLSEMFLVMTPNNIAEHLTMDFALTYHKKFLKKICITTIICFQFLII